MIVYNIHPWDVTVQEAARIQKNLAAKVLLTRSLRDVHTAAGADCSFDVERNEACAGVIVFSFPDLRVLTQVSYRAPMVFPYVPGFLTFREGPALLGAFAQLNMEPDVIMFDGQGVAHPRRLGIASHMGLLLNKPTIGCAKSILCGQHETLSEAPGSLAPLMHRGEKIGEVLRTKAGVKPVYVSPGHLIDFETSLDIVRRCLDGYRLPKPTRLADRFVGKAIKDFRADHKPLLSL